MPRRILPEKMAEARRLRIEENKTTPRIAKLLGISNFSVYAILRDLGPWNPGLGRERHKRGWTVAELSALRRLYPSATETRETICAALPGRAGDSIVKQANSKGMKRPRRLKYVDGLPPIIRDLRREREIRNMTRPQLAKRMVYHPMQITSWELGKAMPKWKALTDWATALGFDVILQRTTPVKTGAARSATHVRSSGYSMFG